LITKTHRFILIGHGGISTKYIAALSKLSGRAAIVGVVGRNPEKCEAFAGEHGIPAAGTSLREVAEGTQATAAIICTPNAHHYEAVMEASALGLHCLCEKPLHISPDKQADMIRSCRENGVKLGVSYMRRFIPHMMLIKEWMDTGVLGRITVIDAMMKHYRPREYYDSWHGTWEVDGGGPFIQQGSHILDMVLWMAGGYSEVLDAKTFRVFHDIETEDHGYATIRYGNGAIGMIEASTASTGMKREYVEITGTKGSITADYERILEFRVPGMELPLLPESLAANESLFEALTADFIESLDTGREPFINGESAALATNLAVEIYAKAGAPIDIR
jgi:UDP-N-acetyl-2-amino-2-deoxyglucuronate dehydrogenase